ncbi:hypothetical protein [Neokomagataea anthophila]|uniref:HEPN domain-containing protein n=1 Tax=Neokomagataea anthophila TaxID=2826925 RepID=A0ABS5E802_9PROT|nr:hypothetical protein [Neokomagataea anthophila]MBR0560036.1 hypothetical protein [Neokomagataea anthophila]
MDAQYADDWEALAKDERESARIMLAARKWKQAYHHAGIAAECALKYKIMRVHGMNCWPERRERREFYTHDIESLTELAGLDNHINIELLKATRDPHIDAWLIIKDWDINMRYHVPTAFPQALAESAVSAIDTMGLVQWLLK